MVHVKEEGSSVFWLTSDRELERDLALHIEQVDLFIRGKDLKEAILQRNLPLGESEAEHDFLLRVILHLDFVGLKRLNKGVDVLAKEIDCRIIDIVL